MPGKARQSKGKHAPRSKKARAKLRSAAMPLEQSAVAQVADKATPASIPVVREKAAALPKTARAPQYPYIVAELRRIGMLAGIILAILIVLALTLH